MENFMKLWLIVAAFLLMNTSIAFAQEIEAEVTMNTQQLPAEARENLVDFVQQVKDYINSNRWTKEGIGEAEKIKCTINILFQASPKDNSYNAQVFIGSSRPIYKSDHSTASLRILDEKWEFDYTRYQPLSHNDYRFDPLLSFLDFYVYLIIGYDFDSYGVADGTPYFQKAMEIVNKASGTAFASKGWEISGQSTYQRGQLVDELLNPKFRDLREAIYSYHYKGLDLLYKDPIKARKHILSALEKIGKLFDKVNRRSLAIRVFFDTKYLEIAQTFQQDPDKTIFNQLAKIDPSHQNTYDEYKLK
jgi:hypothetical protein